MKTSLVIGIFMVIVLGMLVVAAGRLYLKSRHISYTAFKNSIRRMGWFQVWTFPAALVFVGIFCYVYGFAQDSTASVIITLNYPEASVGQNANGTRFNSSEILSEEVLERAIEKGALENVTVTDLEKTLSVYPVVQGNPFLKEQYHISTEFEVIYEASGKTEHLDADTVVRLVADAYKEFYIDHYTDNFAVLQTEIGSSEELAGMDYLDIVNFLQIETNRISNYMYGLADKASSFLSSKGNTFYSLAEKCTQINEVQLEDKLKSYLLQNGISKDPKAYVGRLKYDNSLADYENQKAKASFDIRNDAIAMYAEEMTRIVLVPTWDSDGEYYMGRTKVGIDTLSIEAEEYSKLAAEYSKQMETNKATIEALENSSESGEDSAAEALVDSIVSSITNISVEAREAAKEYSHARLNQCITGNVVQDSFLVTLALCVSLFVLFLLSLNLFTLSGKILPEGTDKKREGGRRRV